MSLFFVECTITKLESGASMFLLIANLILNLVGGLVMEKEWRRVTTKFGSRRVIGILKSGC